MIVASLVRCRELCSAKLVRTGNKKIGNRFIQGSHPRMSRELNQHPDALPEHFRRHFSQDYHSPQCSRHAAYLCMLSTSERFSTDDSLTETSTHPSLGLDG